MSDSEADSGFSDWEEDAPPCICLFCDYEAELGAEQCFVHMKDAHAFDFVGCQRDLGIPQFVAMNPLTRGQALIYIPQ